MGSWRSGKTDWDIAWDFRVEVDDDKGFWCFNQTGEATTWSSLSYTRKAQIMLAASTIGDAP